MTNIAGVLFLLFSTATNAAGDGLAVTVQERAGLARASEPAVFGVPIPRDWNLADPRTLRLRTAAGVDLPLQADVLARWAAAPGNPAAPAKWVLLSFLDTCAAGESQGLVLDRGNGMAPPMSIIVNTSAVGRIEINTGAALFAINTTNFNLLEQVTINGTPLLQPLSPATALKYTDLNGTNIVAGGSPRVTPRVTRAVVERAGPILAVVRVTGSLLKAGGLPVLDYTARLFFHAGQPEVRVDFTLENNHPIVMDAGGEQPINVRDQGSINSVYIGSLQLALQLAAPGGDLRLLMENGVDLTNPASTAQVLQQSSGAARWDAYVGNVGWPGYEASAVPRLQSYSATPGYVITGPGVSASGTQAAGWLAAWRAGNGPAVQVAVRDFWRKFPKALLAQPDGSVAVDLFPAGTRFHHNLRVGEEITHTVFLRFGLAGASAAAAAQWAAARQTPLQGRVAPSQVVASRVLGSVPAYDLARWRKYERFVRTALEPNPDETNLGLGNGTLLQAVSNYNFFGWQDYGDVPLDYEAFGPHQAGQMNLKYWFTHSMFVHYLRSGEPRWLDLGLAAARHLADPDFCHIPDGGSERWCHGNYFGHSYHDEPGNLNPNRNEGGMNPDLFFGVPDLLQAYHLTGEQRLADVAVEGLTGLDNTLPWAATPLGVERGISHSLVNYVAGYRHTGNAHYLDQIATVLTRTTNFALNYWVTNPTGFVAANPDQPSVRTWMLCQTLWALGGYREFLDEYGLPDTHGAAAALVRYADFIVTFAMQEFKPGYAALPYDYYFDGNQRFNEGNYLDIDNWALVAADALAYAYKFSGDARFLAAAQKFYRTGSEYPLWENNPIVYYDTKGLVNSMTWGLVYMGIAP